MHLSTYKLCWTEIGCTFNMWVDFIEQENFELFSQFIQASNQLLENVGQQINVPYMHGQNAALYTLLYLYIYVIHSCILAPNRIVRGSDYSPAIPLSEDKDIQGPNYV